MKKAFVNVRWGEKMNINLSEFINSTKKFEKVWESTCKNHRILYFQINKGDIGIDSHIEIAVVRFANGY